MKIQLTKFLLLIGMVIARSAVAQQELIFNQNPYNLFMNNCAAPGLNDGITINSHYKKNWVMLPGSPESTQITIDGSAGMNLGLGINLRNDLSGMYSRKSVSGAISYRIKAGAQSSISAGVLLGFKRMSFDYSGLKAESPEEFSSWPTYQITFAPDISFGLLFRYKKLIIGGALNDIGSYASSISRYSNNFSPRYIHQSSFIFNSQLEIKMRKWIYLPSVMMRSAYGQPAQAELLNTFKSEAGLLLGFGLRTNYACFVNAGFTFNGAVRFIYSYEYIRSVSNLAMGCHEIGFCMDINSKNNKQHSSLVTHNSNADEIIQLVDQNNFRIQTLNSRIDSLDKNLMKLKSEIAEMRQNQVTHADLIKAIDHYFDQTSVKERSKQSFDKSSEQPKNESLYKIINPQNENEVIKTDSKNSNFKIVLGVYQVASAAKVYQRFLLRELAIETKLFQIKDHPKKYIYVCPIQEYTNLKNALPELFSIRRRVEESALNVTNGQPWVLQTIIK